mmetsp:Transcript_51073/g.163403  ORF Transcript_51073/g.163403 Transcript_51073/m.163403 type:complete len:147 (+) Transcript_51073:223-663(+)
MRVRMRESRAAQPFCPVPTTRTFTARGLEGGGGGAEGAGDEGVASEAGAGERYTLYRAMASESSPRLGAARARTAREGLHLGWCWALLNTSFAAPRGTCARHGTFAAREALAALAFAEMLALKSFGLYAFIIIITARGAGGGGGEG